MTQEELNDFQYHGTWFGGKEFSIKRVDTSDKPMNEEVGLEEELKKRICKNLDKVLSEGKNKEDETLSR